MEAKDELVDQLKHFEKVVRDAPWMGSSSATIRVSAGGVGIWIAVTSAFLCAILFIVMLLGGGYLYLNMKDHLDAIYMMAPSLNKEVTHAQPSSKLRSKHPDRS